MAGWEMQRPMQRTTIANNISKLEKSHCKSVKMRKDSITQQLPRATAAFGTSSTCNDFLHKTYSTRKMSFFQYKNIQWDSNLKRSVIANFDHKQMILLMIKQLFMDHEQCSLHATAWLCS
jgi:hypothetical protein